MWIMIYELRQLNRFVLVDGIRPYAIVQAGPATMCVNRDASRIYTLDAYLVFASDSITHWLLFFPSSTQQVYKWNYTYIFYITICVSTTSPKRNETKKKSKRFIVATKKESWALCGCVCVCASFYRFPCTHWTSVICMRFTGVTYDHKNWREI